jgi:hypothetical protein
MMAAAEGFAGEGAGARAGAGAWASEREQRLELDCEQWHRREAEVTASELACLMAAASAAVSCDDELAVEVMITVA